MARDRKYALVERERRFLLAGVPSEPPVRVVDIVDRYLERGSDRAAGRHHGRGREPGNDAVQAQAEGYSNPLQLLVGQLPTKSGVLGTA